MANRIKFALIDLPILLLFYRPVGYYLIAILWTLTVAKLVIKSIQQPATYYNSRVCRHIRPF